MRLLWVPFLVVLAACGGSESVGVVSAEGAASCPLLFSDDTSAQGVCVYGSEGRRLLWVSDGEVAALVSETPTGPGLYAVAGPVVADDRFEAAWWSDDAAKDWAWEASGFALLREDGTGFTLAVGVKRMERGFTAYADVTDIEVGDDLAAAWRFLETARVFMSISSSEPD